MDTDGESHKFIISRLPATVGRKIISQYPGTALISQTKIGDYSNNEALMVELLSYTAVKKGDNIIELKTKALIDNHCPDWETVMKLEGEMLKYNCSFFQNGKSLNFLEMMIAVIAKEVIKTLTPLLGK